MSDPATATPLHAQVTRALRKEIRSGEFPEGSKIPSETELCEIFGVSRITVRRALDDLKIEGRIIKVHGKGAYVAKTKATQNVSVLAGFDEAMSAYGHRTRNEVLSLEEEPANASVAANLPIAIGDPVVKLRRLRFLNEEPVSVDVSYLPVEYGRPLATMDLASRDVFLLLEDELDCPLGHARLRIEATRPDAQLANLLELTDGSPVLRIERLTYDRAGVPVDFEFLYYRSDRFRYEISIQRGQPIAPGVNR